MTGLSPEQQREKLRQSLGKARQGAQPGPAGGAAADRPRPPLPGTVTPVAPGVFWARMSIANVLETVNVFLLEDGAGWTVVDTGTRTDANRAQWQTLFDKAMGGKPVTRVIATHYHNDHMGLAGWLTERANAEFRMSALEWRIALHSVEQEPDDVTELWRRFFAQAGVAAATLRDYDFESFTQRDSLPLPRTMTPIAHGDTLTIGGRLWRIKAHGGHTPEHLCLVRDDDKVLIGGDHVLSGLQISLVPCPVMPEFDPVAGYRRALDRLMTLPADTLVLPAHGMPYRTLHGYVRDARARLNHRLDMLETACAEPMTAAAIVARSAAKAPDTYHYYLNVADTQAHLRHLAALDRLWPVGEGGGGQRFVRAT
jgi:glyoxylase-like metal-dependent hydrolase (beta-lactamase superfamily II)